MQNKIFVISGPVAVGKTTVAKELFKVFPQLQKGTSYTTREARAGETEDKIMKYISEEKFNEKITSNDFIEWAKVHQYYYGTDKKVLLENLEKGPILLNIDVQGGLNLADIQDNVVLIFILPSSIKSLKERLLKRYNGKIDQKDYDSRLKSANNELKLAKQYKYQVINADNQLENTIAELKVILSNELNS